jgi:hypothetical protein
MAHNPFLDDSETEPSEGAAPQALPTCGYRRGDRLPCPMPAGHGTAHVGFGTCAQHGGDSDRGKAKAAARRAVREIESFSGSPVAVDPIAAILDEVSRTAGHVQWLSTRIAAWTMNADGYMPEWQASWLLTYQTERKHLVVVAKAAIDAGIAERHVKLAEDQGALLAGAISQILDQLDLTYEQQHLVPTIVPGVLRAISVRQDQDADSFSRLLPPSDELAPEAQDVI